MVAHRTTAPAPASLLDILERNEPQGHGSALWRVDGTRTRDDLADALRTVLTVHPGFRCVATANTPITGELDVPDLDQYLHRAISEQVQTKELTDSRARDWAVDIIADVPDGPGGLPLLVWALRDGRSTAVLLRLDEHYCDYDLAQRAIVLFIGLVGGTVERPAVDAELQWLRYEQAVATTFIPVDRQRKIERFWADRSVGINAPRFGRSSPAGQPTSASRVLTAEAGTWAGPLATAGLAAAVAGTVMDMADVDAVAVNQILGAEALPALPGVIETSSLTRQISCSLLSRAQLAEGLPAVVREWQNAVRHRFFERRTTPSLHRMLDRHADEGGVVVKMTLYRYDLVDGVHHETGSDLPFRPVEGFEHPATTEQNPHELYLFLALTPGGSLTSHTMAGSALDAGLPQLFLDRFEGQLSVLGSQLHT